MMVPSLVTNVVKPSVHGEAKKPRGESRNPHGRMAKHRFHPAASTGDVKARHFLTETSLFRVEARHLRSAASTGDSSGRTGCSDGRRFFPDGRRGRTETQRLRSDGSRFQTDASLFSSAGRRFHAARRTVHVDFDGYRMAALLFHPDASLSLASAMQRRVPVTRRGREAIDFSSSQPPRRTRSRTGGIAGSLSRVVCPLNGYELLR